MCHKLRALCLTLDLSLGIRAGGNSQKHVNEVPILADSIGALDCIGATLPHMTHILETAEICSEHLFSKADMKDYIGD